MSAKKLILDFDYDFLLIGIISSAIDYKLCWQINKALAIELEKKEDLILKVNQPKASRLELNLGNAPSPAFSFYSYFDEVNHIRYTLMANKSDASLLIKEEQRVDFFLIIDGLYDEEIENLIQSIRQLSKIITAYQIDPNQLKSKQNLIFE